MVDKSDLDVGRNSEPSGFSDQSQSESSYEVAQATTTTASSSEAQQTLEWGIKGSQTTVEGGDATYILSFSGGQPVGDQKISISIELQLDNGDNIDPAELEDLSGSLANALKANAPAGFKVVGDGMGPVTIEIDGSATVNNMSFTLPTNDDSEVEPLEDFSIVLSDPSSNTANLVTRLSTDLKEVRTRLSDNDQKDQNKTVDTDEGNAGAQPTLTAERVDSVDETAIKARLEIGADNTVQIPGDVQIDAILVSGDDIIIRGTDGSLYVIVDGFKQVPTIQLNGFDIPAEALTASLNAANILPAAGPDGGDQQASTSSGGNFATDPGNVGDPFDITDLLPPTAFDRAFTNAEEFQPFLPRTVSSAPNLPLEILSVIPTNPVVSDPALPGGSNEGSGDDETESDVTIQAGSTPVVSLEFASDLSGIQVTDGTGNPINPILDENGVPVVFVWTLVGSDTIVGSVGGIDVIQIVIDLPSPIPADGIGGGDITTTLLDDFPHQYGPNGADVANVTNLPILATDGGGNTDTATIDIVVLDDIPVVNGSSVSVDEEGLTDGNAGDSYASGDLAGEAITAGGTLGVEFGADGAAAAAAIVLASSGATWSQTTATTGTLTGAGGDWTIVVAADGSYTFTLINPLTHATAGSEDDFVIDVTFTATDGDGDTQDGSFSVTVDDDAPEPVITVNAAQLVTDESVRDLGGDTNFDDENGETDPFGHGTLIGYAAMAANFLYTATTAAGADGLDSSSETLTNSSGGDFTGQDSLLEHTATGNSIFLFTEGGQIVGREGTDAINALTGDVVFAVGFDGLNIVLAQYEAIIHGNTANPDDAETLNNLIFVTLSVTDGDGDTVVVTSSTALDLAIDDDGPSIGTIQNGLASNTPASAVTTGSLNFIPGSDDDGGVTGITLDTSGLTSGGNLLVTAVVGNVLTAYADVDSSGTVNGGDTSVFTLTINTTGGPSNGTYSFDLIAPLDGTVVNTSIGGSTAFGAGPAGVQVLNDGGVNDLALISGWEITGSFDQVAWYGGAIPNPATDLSLEDVNGSTGGWGVNNNNFTGGEFMRFDFGNVDDFDGLGPYAPPAVTLATVTYATFDLIGYGGSETIDFVIHHTDSSTSSFTASAADFGSPYTISADAGKFIEYIDVLSVNANGGAKISLTDVGVQQTTTDVDIGFTVTLADGDGDTTSGSFVINVADSNTPSTATPVILDLDGDGIEYTMLSSESAAIFDYDGDGLGETTAWVGGDDGLLAIDLNNDGIVNDGSEIVFSQYAEGAETDLEGLSIAFDTNQDGKISSADELFGQFGVWQDSNGDGITDAGEYHTLTELGIVEIGLQSDGVQSSSVDGSVTIFGTSSYTMADGSTGDVGDVSFDYLGNSSENADGTTESELLNVDQAGLTGGDVIQDYVLGDDTVDLTELIDVASGDSVTEYVDYDPGTGELIVDTTGSSNFAGGDVVATVSTGLGGVDILYDDDVAGPDQTATIV